MKVIDLLNKIANGDIPKSIKYDGYIYQWNNNIKNYEREIDIGTTLNWDYIAMECLNEEVEIIEEEPKPLTKKDVEALGYACGEIKKCFINGWKKSLENKPFKEDKKIEKLNVIPYEKCIHDVTHKEKEMLLEIRETQLKFNEIIDYLEDNK